METCIKTLRRIKADAEMQSSELLGVAHDIDNINRDTDTDYHSITNRHEIVSEITATMRLYDSIIARLDAALEKAEVL